MRRSSIKSGQEEALRRIAICRAMQSEELELSGLRLTELPEAIYELGWLKRLSFQSANLEELPNKFFNVFQNLEELGLPEFGHILPTEIVKLQSLKKLRVSGGIWSGDVGLDQLPQLTHLELGHSLSSALEDVLPSLVNLTELRFWANDFGERGVTALSKLVNLRCLYASVRFNTEDLSELKALCQLRELGISSGSMSETSCEFLEALSELEDLNLQGSSIGPKGARHLAGLTRLKRLSLDYSGIRSDGLRALHRLVDLRDLSLKSSAIGSYGALIVENFPKLRRLDVSDNSIGDDGICGFKGLVELEELNLNNNRVGDEGALVLAELPNLRRLELNRNAIGEEGIAALGCVSNLERLCLNAYSVGEEGVFFLELLKEWNFDNSQDNRSNIRKLVSAIMSDALSEELGGASPDVLTDTVIAASSALCKLPPGVERIEALHPFYSQLEKKFTTKVADLLEVLLQFSWVKRYSNQAGPTGARALARIESLKVIELSGNNIGDGGIEALSRLSGLTRLNVHDNAIGPLGVQSVSRLRNLRSLSIGRNPLGADGVYALSSLAKLAHLDVENTDVTDFSPLVGMPELRDLDCSGCSFDHDVPALWLKSTLKSVELKDAKLPGVPDEIINTEGGSSCLSALRAHIADLAAGWQEISDVKVMILGNGRVGKTQICRRLRKREDEPFDEAVPSTHGVKIWQASAPHASKGSKDVALKLWDFGGQDIYHGTHALFLKSRAIFLLTWMPGSEETRFHQHDGFTFRNQPLAYWLAYVRKFGNTTSPLIVLQAQCDRPESDREPPLPKGALDNFPFKKVLQYSAKTDRGRAALDEALADAVSWQRSNQGVGHTGIGRAKVKAEMERLYASGQRILSREEFDAICADAGNVSSPDRLLEFLHNLGVVFHRGGLFADRIILDQAWALDAVYSVFDRASKCFRNIERARGKFRRSELQDWVWQSYSPADQELFLSFMRQCGICFSYRKGDALKRIEEEYIAPDLLPEKDDETIAQLQLKWNEATPADAKAILTSDLLSSTLMRAMITDIGASAGLAAEYWRDGICFYDATTKSRAMIEQRWTDGWAGQVDVQTKGGDAQTLCDRLVAKIEKMEAGVTVSKSSRRIFDVVGKKAEAEAVESSSAPIMPGHEPAATSEFVVSYAWGDDSPEGRERHATVEKLCSEAEARGITIIRDVKHMRLGDRISKFMDRIGKGDRVFVILSDKYLRSAYCMHELFEVWRNCREDDDEFISKTRFFVLPCAQISKAADRAQYAIYWRKVFDDMDALVKAHGQLVLSDEDNAEYRRITRFVNETANILKLVQDTLRPRSFDEFVAHGLT